MPFSIKGLISGWTGGLVGSGKSPQQAPESMSNTGSDAPPVYNSVDLAKQAHGNFLANSEGKDDISNIESQDPETRPVRPLFGSDNTWGQNVTDALGVRNGGLQRAAISSITNGIQGKGWTPSSTGDKFFGY